MSFTHDSTGVNPNEFDLVPEGWYPLRIYDAAEMISKEKGYHMVLAKCEIYNDDRYPDAQIWHYVTFIPKGQKGDGISVHFRKCIGMPCEGNDLVDADEWVGQKFMGYIVIEEYQGVKRNKISKVSPPREAAPSTNSKTKAALAAQAPAGADDIPF